MLAQSASLVCAQQPDLAERTAAASREFRQALELEPNLEHGAQLFTVCATCHAADGCGATDGSTPAIAGQHVSVLVKQLVDFRNDRRWNVQMQAIASQHRMPGPQDLLDVASYLESLPRWPPLEGGIGDGKSLQRGASVYFRDCESCHGPLGQGELRRMRPRLAGQHYAYLLRQLNDTAAGQRPGMDAGHVRRIRDLSEEERRGVADYLSRLSPDLTSTRRRDH
ncbi:MAG TPA: c-type cytochrome [Steroidobacteraceae bacterium]|nr:c-type cytochrome [Steroidobacteraceae bacterium]